VARAGASAITNPVSNAYSCDGIAPVKSMFREGVNVGLGSDGAYVNCSMDMVEQMKFCALIQNVTHFDPKLVSTERVIEMATIGSARAMGIDHLVGSLEPGKRADLCAFDLNKPHATVGNRPISALVFSGHGTDVDTVVIDGKVRLRGGEFVGFDREQEVMQEATRRAREAIERAGIADRVFVDWRHGWDDDG
jgi:5-methylthioadenosine/S-adenosylhomocysteine deaminase